MSKRETFFFILIFFICFKIYSEESNLQIKSAIVHKSFLEVRESPSLKSKVIGIKIQADLVEIIEETTKPDIVSGWKNHWLKIKMNDSYGWIFGAYVFPINKYQDKKLNPFLKKEIIPYTHYPYTNKIDINSLKTKKHFLLPGNTYSLLSEPKDFPQTTLPFIPKEVFVFEPKSKFQNKSYGDPLYLQLNFNKKDYWIYSVSVNYIFTQKESKRFLLMVSGSMEGFVLEGGAGNVKLFIYDKQKKQLLLFSNTIMNLGAYTTLRITNVEEFPVYDRFHIFAAIDSQYEYFPNGKTYYSTNNSLKQFKLDIYKDGQIKIQREEWENIYLDSTQR